VKKLTQKAGKVRSLPAPYQQQLSSYALAAAAAGVSVLALTQPSDARIIYTRTHHVIADGGSYGLDFDGDGRTDLTIQNKYYHSCTTYGGCHDSQLLGAKMTGTNQAVFNVFGAVAMRQGAQIGPERAFHGGREVMAGLGSLSHTTSAFGSWINVKDRYLGVKFTIKGKTHYGWARLSVKLQPPLTITATLTGYAYETIPGKAIAAGATKGAEEHIDATSLPATLSVPARTPATLGVLALGAPPLSIWRRKESVPATALQ
jgi:hypothetical protein